MITQGRRVNSAARVEKRGSAGEACAKLFPVRRIDIAGHLDVEERRKAREQFGKGKRRSAGPARRIRSR